ncbi:uncharacterized protein At4g04775-like [Nicotiana tomentosiformis]|uniref:uncharacterized protein At4g04775-like n=1 Tax=Nicotiana tomentosiformis TaxID=4098 RepID=UPI00388CA3DD
MSNVTTPKLFDVPPSLPQLKCYNFSFKFLCSSSTNTYDSLGSISSSSVTSRRRCYCGEIANNFTSMTTNNPERRFYKCAKPENELCGYWEWQDEALPNKALIVIIDFKSKLDAANVKIRTLNMLLDACKLERDKLMEKVNILKAINDIEVNKVREMEVKVMHMKMFIMVAFALLVGFVVALLMKSILHFM